MKDKAFNYNNNKIKKKDIGITNNSIKELEIFKRKLNKSMYKKVRVNMNKQNLN